MEGVYTPMAEIFPERIKQGDVVIEPYTIDALMEARLLVDAATNHRPHRYTPAGRYVRLLIGPELFMSDTLMEHASSLEAVENAAGDVLVAGLGLGVALLPLLASEAVSSVSVLELNQSVIDLVVPRLPNREKLSVFQGDARTWLPEPGTRFQTIFVDIWPDISRNNLAEMDAIETRLRPYSDGWIGSWSRGLVEQYCK